MKKPCVGFDVLDDPDGFVLVCRFVVLCVPLWLVDRAGAAAGADGVVGATAGAFAAGAAVPAGAWASARGISTGAVKSAHSATAVISAFMIGAPLGVVAQAFEVTAIEPPRHDRCVCD